MELNEVLRDKALKEEKTDHQSLGGPVRPMEGTAWLGPYQQLLVL